MKVLRKKNSCGSEAGEQLPASTSPWPSRIVGAITLVLPFFVLYWLVPLFSKYTIGNDYKLLDRAAVISSFFGQTRYISVIRSRFCRRLDIQRSDSRPIVASYFLDCFFIAGLLEWACP